MKMPECLLRSGLSRSDGKQILEKHGHQLCTIPHTQQNDHSYLIFFAHCGVQSAESAHNIVFERKA